MLAQLGDTGKVLALGLTMAAFLLGGVVLIWGLVRDRDEPVGDWRDDEDDGPSPAPIGPVPDGGDGGLPLPVADQSALRLRERGTIADRYPTPKRRPVHPPDPEPVTAPQPSPRTRPTASS